MYIPIDNHFILKYNKKLYDINGDVTANYKNSNIYNWDSYVWVDDIHYKRILN